MRTSQRCRFVMQWHKVCLCYLWKNTFVNYYPCILLLPWLLLPSLIRTNELVAERFSGMVLEAQVFWGPESKMMQSCWEHLYTHQACEPVCSTFCRTCWIEAITVPALHPLTRHTAYTCVQGDIPRLRYIWLKIKFSSLKKIVSMSKSVPLNLPRRIIRMICLYKSFCIWGLSAWSPWENYHWH